MRAKNMCFYQQHNLMRRFGTSKMHFSLPTRLLVLLSVLKQRFCCFWFVVAIVGLCVITTFVALSFVSFLVLQSSSCGRESLLPVCLLGVMWLLLFCGFSSRCRGFVIVWLWYFLSYALAFFICCNKSLYPLFPKCFFCKHNILANPNVRVLCYHFTLFA